LSFPNSFKCVDDSTVVGHDGDLKLFTNMCFLGLTIVWKPNNGLMSFLERNTFDILACYWVAMIPPMKSRVVLCAISHIAHGRSCNW